MKKMSKIAVLGLSLVMVLVLLAACGASAAPEELAGKWSLAGAEVMGEVLTMDDMGAAADSIQMSFEFVDGKTVKITGDTEDESLDESIGYTYLDGVVTIADSSGTITLTLVDGMLRYDVGGMVLLFARG